MFPSVTAHTAADINDRGRTITNFLQQLKLCNPASFFKKSNYSTWISQNVTKKETTNKFHTLDYILMPFLDFKLLHRDSTAIINKLLPSTDHYLVKMIISLRINNTTINYKKQQKLPKPNTINNNPPTPSPTTKPKSAPRRIFLTKCTSTIASYNQQVAKAISQHQASNSNTHITQSDITTILQSSSFPIP
jgi:hypothetical protein